jgi:hypothetical protein
MNSKELFDYANQFARASEVSGNGTTYPTVREAAKRLGVTHSEIEEIAAGYCSEGYLGIAVGFRTGSGYGSYRLRGDRLVEAYL